MDEPSAVLAFMAIVQKHPAYGVHYADVKVCRVIVIILVLNMFVNRCVTRVDVFYAV